MPIDVDRNDNTNKEILKLTENRTFSDKPILLTKNLSWYDIDIDNDKDMKIVLNFLNNNYHDAKSEISFCFTAELLKWQLGFNKDNKKIAIGVMFKNKMVGCIFGVVRKLNLNGKLINGSETNLLCLDKKLRKLNLAPLMIKEITRRNNYNLKINNSIYTTSLVLPNILSTATYYERYVGFSRLMDIGMLDKGLLELGYDNIKNYFHKMVEIDKNHHNYTNIKSLTEEQLQECYNKLNEKLMSLYYSYIFDYKQFKHIFLNDCVTAYVVFSNDKITDMISYYKQPSRIIESNTMINTYYLYYYFNNKNNLESIVSLVINDAIKNNIDRIRVLGIMDYSKLANFNFEDSEVKLNYYIYNWKCNKININKIGYLVF